MMSHLGAFKGTQEGRSFQNGRRGRSTEQASRRARQEKKSHGGRRSIRSPRTQGRSRVLLLENLRFDSREAGDKGFAAGLARASRAASTARSGLTIAPMRRWCHYRRHARSDGDLVVEKFFLDQSITGRRGAFGNSGRGRVSRQISFIKALRHPTGSGGQGHETRSGPG